MATKTIYRGKVRTRDFPPDWPQRRKRVLNRDNHRCVIEGPRCTRKATEVDHIIPRVQGGHHGMSNLRAVCKECHKDRSRENYCSTKWW